MRQLFAQIAHLLAQRQHDQAAQTGMMRLLSSCLAVEHTNRHAASLIDQCRKACQLDAGTIESDLLRQLLKIPACDITLLDAVSGE